MCPKSSLRHILVLRQLHEHAHWFLSCKPNKLYYYICNDVHNINVYVHVQCIATIYIFVSILVKLMLEKGSKTIESE